MRYDGYLSLLFLGMFLGTLIKKAIWLKWKRWRDGEPEYMERLRRQNRALASQYFATFLNNVISTTAAAVVAILLLRQNVPGLSGNEPPRGRNLLQLMGMEGLSPVIFAVGACITALGWGCQLMIAAKLDEQSIEDYSQRDKADQAMRWSWLFAVVMAWFAYRLWTDFLTMPLQGAL